MATSRRSGSAAGSEPPDSQTSGFARSTRAPETATLRSFVETGTVIGLIAMAIGPAPAGFLYVARYWNWFEPAMREHLLVRGATILAVGGALLGAALGAGVYLGRRGSGNLRRRILFCTTTVAAGAALPSAWIVWQFGALPHPYFGGPETYTVSGLAGLALSTGCVRFETPELGWSRRLLLAVKPLPLILLAAGVPLLLVPQFAGLDLDTLRVVAFRLGLAPLGAIVGAYLGAIIGLWVAVCTWLAARRRPGDDRAYL